MARNAVRTLAAAPSPTSQITNSPVCDLDAFAQLELIDVKRLGLGDGADDGMKGFALRERMNAESAVGQPDELIITVNHIIAIGTREMRTMPAPPKRMLGSHAATKGGR